jgi:hypothetical protein
VGLVPMVGAGFSPRPWLRVHAAAGIAGYPNNIEYFAEIPERTAVLSPYAVRARVEVGVEFLLGARKISTRSGRRPPLRSR